MATSDGVVIQSPTSFVGSARRIWKLTRAGDAWLKVLTVPSAIVLVALAWCLVLIYTLCFGLLLVPWRLFRRGGRRRKQDALRHEELLEAAGRTRQQAPIGASQPARYT